MEKKFIVLFEKPTFLPTVQVHRLVTKICICFLTILLLSLLFTLFYHINFIGSYWFYTALFCYVKTCFVILNCKFPRQLKYYLRKTQRKKNVDSLFKMALNIFNIKFFQRTWKKHSIKLDLNWIMSLHVGKTKHNSLCSWVFLFIQNLSQTWWTLVCCSTQHNN